MTRKTCINQLGGFGLPFFVGTGIKGLQASQKVKLTNMSS